MLPFSTLQVANGVGKDETVPCANRLNNAASNISLATTRVRLIDCVELGAAACDLESVLE